MRLYTSNYDFAGNLPQAVGISGWRPEGWDESNKRKYPKLAPKKWIYDDYSENRDSQKYTLFYGIHVLAKLDPHAVAEELGDGSILCCYEPSGQFCHRLLVSLWFNQAGIKCTPLTLTEKLLIERHGYVNLDGFIGPDD